MTGLGPATHVFTGVTTLSRGSRPATTTTK